MLDVLGQSNVALTRCKLLNMMCQFVMSSEHIADKVVDVEWSTAKQDLESGLLKILVDPCLVR